jgi:hypothetical protein
MWLGAGQAAACRRLSRIAISSRMVLSSSSAWASEHPSVEARPPVRSEYQRYLLE